ncbi:hypothetical protein Tco_1488913, partial [Tanacetum coccineum]
PQPQPQSPSPTVSDASSTVYSTCPSNDSDGELGVSKRLAGKELSNPFIADDLLKIIWLSMYHGLTNLNIGYLSKPCGPLETLTFESGVGPLLVLESGIAFLQTQPAEVLTAVPIVPLTAYSFDLYAVFLEKGLFTSDLCFEKHFFGLLRFT